MRNILSTLLLLVSLTAVANGEAKPWKNGRLKVSDNQRFIQHENGKPFFWLGDTGWLLPERADRDEAAYYLKDGRCQWQPHLLGRNVERHTAHNPKNGKRWSADSLRLSEGLSHSLVVRASE